MEHLPASAPGLPSYLTVLVPYALIYFFVSLSDAVMSYISPVYIESWVSHPALMGLIISSSSVVGLLCDLVFPRIFKHRSHRFFVWTALLFALLFPALFRFLPPVIPVFFAGMAVWGIYYELLMFSDFNFIKRTLSRPNYPAGWGILHAFKAAAYFLGPLIAAFLAAGSFTPVFTTAIGFTLVSVFLLSISSLNRRHHLPKSDPDQTPEPVSVSASVTEIRIWSALIRRVWPVYLLVLLLYMIDAAFWTIGTLVSEQLLRTTPLGGLFLPAYSLPSLFVGLLIGRLFPSTGKKRLAFTFAVAAGLLLSLVGIISSPVWLIMTVFASSLLLSITFPQMFAVFEDYVSRLGQFGNDMVGLQSSASSLAYIIGPILAGALSALVGNLFTFTILGLVLVGYALIALLVTPRKIRLPRQELQTAAAETAPRDI